LTFVNSKTKIMTIKKSYIRKVKSISIGGSLSILLAAGFTGSLQSCGSNESEADYEVEEKYSQGVKTYITETEAGKFKITDEVSVPADSSKAIVTYLDGRVEELTKEQSKALIDKEIATNGSERVGQGFGLGNALLYGGMGYFLARTLSPSYGQYRPPYRDDERRTNGTSTAAAAASRKYYANESAYTKSNAATSTISKSRTFTSKPSSSRGGFFGRSSRGGGFGG
jgi:hypothetical protein